MKVYTIGALAKLAGVSVRTLHYYDELGLLRPSSRTKAGYRQYDQQDLIRLQQIMFYRELDVPLQAIEDILDAESFHPIKALQRHRVGLVARCERLLNLIETVDRTITQMEEGGMGIKDEELFSAFSAEEAERYRRQARETWGEQRVETAEYKLKQLSKQEWEKIQQEGEYVAEQLAMLLDRPVDDPEVQRYVARHHAWIENFYPAPAEVYRGLGQMYVEHPEFRAYYDQYAEGLADFLQEAMAFYASEQLE